MRAPDVDLAQPRTWPLRFAWAAVWSIVVAMVWTGHRMLVQRTQPVEATAKAGPSAPEPGQRTAPYHDDALQWLRMADAPLGSVLAGIESIQIEGTRVARLEVDLSARTAGLDVEAPDVAAAARWLDGLQANTAGWRWRLVSTRSSDPHVLAAFEAHW